MISLSLDPNPLLDLHAFVATWPRAIGELAPIPDDVATMVATIDGDPEPLRAAIRDLLRHGGFKPSGRNKPASEYLARGLPSINLAVDAGNLVSLHGGLPISVIDLDRVAPPLRVAIAPEGTTYPFNPSGQVFDASGLVCLFDAEGVSATAVKDAQRTKTSASTVRTLSIVWGARAFAAHGRRVAEGYRGLSARLGAEVTDVVLAAV
jgi:DNA/RNA-binding domain of Phe-tRNA-synthetase-like protein